MALVVQKTPEGRASGLDLGEGDPTVEEWGDCWEHKGWFMERPSPRRWDELFK